MVAVLPFENLSGDAAQDYFSNGLTEEMISQLGRIDTSLIGVIARTSSIHYKNSRKPMGAIGAELEVEYVLEGSVRRWGSVCESPRSLSALKPSPTYGSQAYDREVAVDHASILIAGL